MQPSGLGAGGWVCPSFLTFIFFSLLFSAISLVGMQNNTRKYEKL